MPLVKSLTSCHYLKENVKSCVCLCLCSSQWGTGTQEPQLVVGTAGKVVKDVGSSQNERRVHSQSLPTYPGPECVSVPSLAHLSEAMLVFPLHRKNGGKAQLSVLQLIPDSPILL